MVSVMTTIPSFFARSLIAAGLHCNLGSSILADVYEEVVEGPMCSSGVQGLSPVQKSQLRCWPATSRW
jgi:hypothetical protein